MITDKLPTVPYVNSQMLSAYTGRSIRLICRVDQVSQDGLKAKVEAADKGTVVVTRLPGSSPYSTHYIVLTGQVNPDLSVSEQTFESFGNSFDLDNFNKCLGFMAKVPSLFVS